jgi:N-methylhydantoinase A
MTLQIGVDTGGTHTDLVLLDATRGLFKTLKVPTTPDDLSLGILDGVDKLLKDANLKSDEVTRFVYGTTLVTNIIVEKTDLEIGLITTEGFRDVLEIGRASRKPNIYDIHWRPNPPVVPRRHRQTVKERIDASGSVVVPLDEASVVAALQALRRSKIQAVAVCLLHAYANPAHEEAIKEIAAKRFPELMVSLSSEIVREFREYERSSTTAINAYVMGPMRRHLDGLSAALHRRGVHSTPYIMRGNGGVMSFSMGKRYPVAITHSGPVAGIVGSAILAKAAGFSDIITFDMGGTSSDISLIHKGEPAVTTSGKLAGYPILLPVIDLVTIGAGGGSIAQLDAGVGLRVGPRSAGSVPGPLCYGQGGEHPTVTDANLITGRLNAEYFLAGARRIYPELARIGITERIAQPLKLDPMEAALGILDVAEAHMVNAIKLISVEKGLDPRKFTLVGFGGAGPLHVANLAEAIGIRTVLVPPAPGNASAAGLLSAEIRQDLVRTLVCTLDKADAAELERVVDDLVADAVALMTEEHVPAEDQHVAMTADLRYGGQSHEITLPLERSDFTDPGFARLGRRFADRHKALYGYELTGRAIELVNIRTSAFGSSPRLPWPELPAASASPVAQSERKIWHRVMNGAAPWPVYRFETVSAGVRINGPAIVEYPGSTLVVPPNWSATYDRWLNAILRHV